ncbi:signal recognition particle-docking protein FtsY [Leucothrix pacifica]|uniref:Signal recognition particle receptor FtsY n=1 Tax=Leucothrix pacifica TaxID=1247513 RepID=A0A317CSN3_9GAMM|nr:signal recognition particle-docking protein FtsY [Leucothrix pacifica]PWQ99450.1 signal recognition particle-docking protein FtsY [Leucothrix pacifica]
MFKFFKKKKQPEQVNDVPATDATDNQQNITQQDAAETISDTPAVVERTGDTPAPSALDDAKSANPSDIATNSPETSQDEPTVIEASQPEPQAKPGLFSRLKSGLSKTGSSLTEGLGNLFLGAKQIDDEVLEDLETRLLMADVGIEATTEIIDQLTAKVDRNELADSEALMQALYGSMSEVLKPVAKPLVIDSTKKPTVILMVGINGAGKTTTIGKLAKKFQNDGKKVMLAAGDTFRAAAVEQLQTWGQRNDVPVIAQGQGSDSASVIYDGMEAAKARGIDILLADTAGRLHTQTNLMEELKKVKRVMQKIDPDAPHEVMLVVDASIGQNALAQAKEFNEALGLTGITVTKLDGTAKGGILFAIAKQTGIPVRFVGVGESIDDLQVFDAEQFTGALLGGDKA